MTTRPRSDHRTVIVHFANSTEEQIDRIARLGAASCRRTPTTQSGSPTSTTRTAWARARADTMVRSASVLRRGIPLSLHSDLPDGSRQPP